LIFTIRSLISLVGLTCIDQFSKYGWATIIRNKTGAAVATAFRDIIADGKEEMGGPPTTVRSDNGSEFISKQFQAVLAENKIKHILSDPHAPTQNAMIERFNRTIKGMVYRYLTHWNLAKISNASLQKIVANYNTSRHTTTKQTPDGVFAGAPEKPRYTKKLLINAREELVPAGEAGVRVVIIGLEECSDLLAGYDLFAAHIEVFTSALEALDGLVIIGLEECSDLLARYDLFTSNEEVLASALEALDGLVCDGGP